jgi:hypothetical protein
MQALVKDLVSEAEDGRLKETLQKAVGHIARRVCAGISNAPREGTPGRGARGRNPPIAATQLIRGLVPMLRGLERLVHPRCPTPFEATKRTVGGRCCYWGAAFLSPCR